MSIPREYKLMLHARHFDAERRQESLERYWRDCLIPAIALTEGAEAGGDPFRHDEDRTIRFFDSIAGNGALLRDAGYILRERIKHRSDPPRPKDRQVTLKYRHPDYGRAAVKDLSGLSENDAETKLEADIGIHADRPERPRPLRRSYAHSTGQRLDGALDLGRLRQPLELFPGLGRGLAEERVTADPATGLSPVAGLEVFERLFEGPEARLAGAKTRFSLALWFDGVRDPDRKAPLLAEISYKLSRGDLDGGVRVIDSAERLFASLQEHAFFNPRSSTKTAFVYAYPPGQDRRGLSPPASSA